MTKIIKLTLTAGGINILCIVGITVAAVAVCILKPSSKGSKLAMMVGCTSAVKIKVQMAFAQIGPEIKCHRVPV